MNKKQFYLSLCEWAIDLVIGVVVLFVIYRLFTAWFTKRYKVEEDNIAYRVLTGCVLFASGYCISGALEPVIISLKLLQAQNLSTGIFIWECVKYVVIFISLGLVISILSSFVTLVFYNSITRSVDELQEVADGKIAYAIFMGILVITISLFTKDAYTNLLNALVPYPSIPVLPR